MKSIQSKFLTSVIVGLLVIALAVGLCAYLMTSQLLHGRQLLSRLQRSLFDAGADLIHQLLVDGNIQPWIDLKNRCQNLFTANCS